jgi:hypothetical protein
MMMSISYDQVSLKATPNCIIQSIEKEGSNALGWHCFPLMILNFL